MAFIPITTDEIDVGKPVFGPTGFGKKVKDNFDFLFGQIGTIESGMVLNGSFEIEDDSNPGQPINWDTATYPAGTIARVNSESNHGEWSLQCTHPGGVGNGGGNAESDYIECSPLWANRLAVIYRTTIATNLKVQIKVEYFTGAKITISTETLLDQTSNAIVNELFGFLISPPATARFLKITLVGGLDDTDPGSLQSVFFDMINLTQEIIYEPGEYILLASDTEVFQDTGGVFVKMKEIKCGRSGRIRVHFEIKQSNPQAVTLSLRINGVERYQKTNATGGYIAYDTDISINAGDTVEGWLSESAAGFAYVKNFRIKIDNPPEGKVVI